MSDRFPNNAATLRSIKLCSYKEYLFPRNSSRYLVSTSLRLPVVFFVYTDHREL